MPALRHVILPLSLLLILTSTAACADSAPTTRVLAVRPAPDQVEAISKALDDGALKRWILPEDRSLQLEVGAGASGDIDVEVRTLPVEEAFEKRLAGLPVELRDDAIVLGGTVYGERHQALALRLPAAEKPSFVVVGQDLALVARVVDQVLIAASGHRWHSFPEGVDYLLWENRWSHRSGRWQANGEGFTVDPSERDDMAERRAAYAAMVPLERSSLVLRVSRAVADDAAMHQLADTLDQAVAEMARRVPTRLEKPIEIVVEPDFLIQGQRLADIGAAVLTDAGRLHLVYHPDDLDLYLYELGRALVRYAGGDLPPWLEDGAALWLSRRWYGRTFEEWLPDLAHAEVLPDARELLARERQENGSAVLWPPVAAAVIERISGKSLASKLLTPPDETAVRSILVRHLASADRLDERKQRTLEAEAAAAAERQKKGRKKKEPAPDPEAPERPAPEPPELPFQRGISFAMANGLEIGYHAPGVDDQLQRLAALGANSVSLMPFAYQRRPDQPEMRFLNRSPVSETDVGVVHAARRAHEQGFTVLWKPHIWVSYDSWPGDIAMSSEEDWRTWWRQYRRYILHHAVLAQAAGSEMFALGVELGRTVERENEWRQLIDAVRRVFNGRLTYAGNWWDDYDKVAFWDALDYIGVDAYFPLSSAPDADRAALIAGTRKALEPVAALAQKTGKPVLFTEIGFAARKGAWISPHAEGGDFDLADQTKTYDAFLTALGRPPWLAGIYFWKAFSHSRAEGGERPDFRFLGRGAEGVIGGYFESVE